MCNTFFRKAENHLITYQSGNSRTQIDYVMVRRVDRRMVVNVKVIAGLETVQQHRLLIADLDLRVVKKQKTRFAPRLRLRKLKDAGCAERFREGVRAMQGDVEVATSTEERWNVMRRAWLKNAEEVCGWSKGSGRRRETWWWTTDVAVAVEKKQELFRKWKRSGERSDHREYVAARRTARRVVWEAKERRCQELAEELESERGRKSFFRIAKQMSKERLDVAGPTCMKDENGNIVFGEGVREVWKRYMEKLMNEENDWDGEVNCDVVQGPMCMFSENEITEALKKCSSGKAAGPSGVVSEMIAASGDVGIKWMTDLCNNILLEGRTPSDWSKSVLVPLYKNKGDPLVCGSYRGIKLLEQSMKLYERVLESRIRSKVNIDHMQFGFMPGKGTTDAIFIVRQVQEKFLAKKKDLYFAFVDLEKAFDRVPREVVRWALRMSGVDEWLVEAVMALFVDTSTVVRTGSGDTESFNVRVGVHQGSVLSPLLFAIVMDVVSRHARVGLPWEVLYADDLVLMAISEAELKRKLAVWRRAMSGKGMKVNTGKTKVMVSAPGGGAQRESGDFPCGVCGTGVGASSVRCTQCLKWVHRRCSGVSGSLSVASVDFKCKRCRGLLPAPSMVSDGVSLVVEGERYGVVSSFPYLGDTLTPEW